MDTQETVAGRRSRASTHAAENPEEVLGNQKKRCRVDDLHMAFVAEKEVAKERAQ